MSLELVVTYQNQNLTTNFDEIKAEVGELVAKYSIEVTDENLAEAKKVMANFNKIKAEIGGKFKEYIADLSRPIDELKSQKKEIEAIIDDGRAKIADEVAKFEVSRLNLAKEKIAEFINAECEKREISPNLINPSEFVKLTAITANGTLTKQTKTEIEARLNAIENEILKAKQEAEAKRQEAERIANEARLKAQAEAEARIQAERERAEKEKAELEARLKAEQEAKERAELEAKTAKATETPKEIQTENGTIIHTFTAVFEVEAKANLSREIVKTRLENDLRARYGTFKRVL
ncbi:MAG: DUF1351 domain-containing protein [Campylobacter sp.]|nr:DUF1351 domain-containing protein [Campylobacter sp.]